MYFKCVRLQVPKTDAEPLRGSVLSVEVLRA